MRVFWNAYKDILERFQSEFKNCFDLEIFKCLRCSRRVFSPIPDSHRSLLGDERARKNSKKNFPGHGACRKMGHAVAPRSLRSFAAINRVEAEFDHYSGRKVSEVAG